MANRAEPPEGVDRGERLRPSPIVVALIAALIPAYVAGGAVLVVTSNGGPEPLEPPTRSTITEATGSPGPANAGVRRIVTGEGPPRPATVPIEPLATRPARPTAISIPSVGIEAEIAGVDGTPDGIRVPAPENAGWYRQGPRPGESGRAIVIGHLDSLEGPAVFATLADADLGAPVEVLDRAGEDHLYEVTEVLDIPKSDYPTDVVYGSTDRPELVLITCGGRFDPETGYEENLVIVAEEAHEA